MDALTNKEYSTDDVERQLINWHKAPKAVSCHPREDHLIPLFAVAGAGLYKASEAKQEAKLVFDETLFKNIKVSGYIYQ